MATKRRIVILWCLGIVPLIVVSYIVYTPIPYLVLKVLSLTCVLLPLSAVAVGTRWGKWVGGAVCLCLAGLVFWPPGSANPTGLRSQYIRSLVAYRETPYVWGGENGRGIDCSGLMRRAMVDALLEEGWRRHDPAMWRQAAFIWWHDCSALEMKNGYSGHIEPVWASRRLNDVDLSLLRPGDLAVMKSGVHVLAYIGDGTWIQADPNLANGGGKVIETEVPSHSGWFGQGVVICRWKNLE